MERRSRDQDNDLRLEEMLGYLNFSAGTPDVRFRRNLNDLYRYAEGFPAEEHPPWEVVRSLLQQKLQELAASKEAFRETEQAATVVELAFGRLSAFYRQFHRDLLHHQSDEALFRPWFLAKACEAMLRLGAPWTESQRLLDGTLDTLNDFVGYRPVAMLRTPQRIEPYKNEWVAPIPLYLRDVGVATGKYHELISLAVDILREAEPEILEQAWFDLELLDEWSLDPRAYDFDHPVNKRPNFLFGQWDPHHLDQQGRYRRFVSQGVTLEAIWQRTRESSEIPERERLFEAAAVLAGTMLMAAAMGGRGPDTHDSSVTFGKLMPKIAKFRDAFYERLLARVTGAHADRLRDEAAALRQPFGGARQHLNNRLAKLRASQLQHVHLAQLFARMGFPEASHRQAEIVPVASARMLCEINSLLTSGHHALDRGQLNWSIECLSQIEDLLERAIQCGALVDPWNMLGFQGQFSLFAAVENSTRDHRVDVLIHLVRQVFRLYARTQGEAAACGQRELEQRLNNNMLVRARWWDTFASTEVHGLDGFSGREAADSARHVATALSAWHLAGEAAGDLGFWREHVTRFNSPKSYALVVDALLQKRDFIASRALLTQWLGQNEAMPLAEGAYSFHQLAMRWMRLLHETVEAAGDAPPAIDSDERWNLTRKLFDYFEANAEAYGEAPHFEWEQPSRRPRAEPSAGDEFDNPADDEEHNDEADRYRAAYEEVVYRDSTADGFEGETLESGPEMTEDQLDAEAQRIARRLQYLVTLGRLWQLAAVRTIGRGILGAGQPAGRVEAIKHWIDQARTLHRGLLELLAAIESYRIADPRGSHEALVEYDRRRRIKESLMGRVVLTCVEMTESARHMLASIDSREQEADLPPWDQLSTQLLRALLRGDALTARALFPTLRQELLSQPVLYVPLSKNGDPRQIVAAHTVQQLLAVLMRGLPRLGLLDETRQLIFTSQEMEQHRPQGEGVVTEFDRLFELGYQAIIHGLVDAASSRLQESSVSDQQLIEAIQLITEGALKLWLKHSRSLRLSALEKVSDKQRWQPLVELIQEYGAELFTPRWLNLGNLRAILHQGLDSYLRSLADEADVSPGLQKLLDNLDGPLNRPQVVEQLTLIIESVAENYAEYKDFNTTTTQSDHGEALYTLLDFLRLKASYQRFAWTIKPVGLAHDELVRSGRMAAAELWRRAVAQRTNDVADWHLKKYQDLCRQYGMRLPTIGDLLAERFVRPLAVDRMRALVRPAIDEARHGQPSFAFNLLEQEIGEFAEHPTGSGLDVPQWIATLEQEVSEVLATPDELDHTGHDTTPIPSVPLAWSDVMQQLNAWDTDE